MSTPDTPFYPMTHDDAVRLALALEALNPGPADSAKQGFMGPAAYIANGLILEATETLAGLMSKTDKAKLNAAEALVFTAGRALTQNAGFHNSLYRGKYLGNTFTAEQDAAIRAGTFDGMFVGDYWTINGVDWVIVGFDIRLNIGDTALTTHHIGVMPRANLYSTQWHTSNDTSMGYVGSAIRANIKASGGAQEKFIAAFGSANVLSFRELYPTTYSGGNATGWVWVDARTELLSEVDVYGFPAWSVGGKGYEVGADKSQLPIFRLRPDFANIRATWWLRSVSSATYAAGVGGDGVADYYGASYSLGVRPLSLIA